MSVARTGTGLQCSVEDYGCILSRAVQGFIYSARHRGRGDDTDSDT